MKWLISTKAISFTSGEIVLHHWPGRLIPQLNTHDHLAARSPRIYTLTKVCKDLHVSDPLWSICALTPQLCQLSTWFGTGRSCNLDRSNEVDSSCNGVVDQDLVGTCWESSDGVVMMISFWDTSPWHEESPGLLDRIRLPLQGKHQRSGAVMSPKALTECSLQSATFPWRSLLELATLVHFDVWPTCQGIGFNQVANSQMGQKS